jgi:hypothetical protein
MTTSESAFVNDIKEIARAEPSAERRRRAAEARFRRLERELERKYEGLPNADSHVARELVDLRRAMLIELEKDPLPTLGSLLDGLIALTNRQGHGHH